jgi:hypothetical protein
MTPLEMTTSPTAGHSDGRVMLITGNSHVAALQNGLPLLAERERGSFAIFGSAARFERTAFFECRPDGVLITDDALAQRVVRLTGEATIRPGPNWGFSLGHPGVLFNTKEWKNCRTSNLPREQGKQSISLGALRAFIEEGFKHVLSFFDCANRIGVSFWIILPPPPRRNGPAIRNLGVPFEQVTTIDRMIRGVLIQKAQSLGVPFVDPPSESFDRDGFLKAEFCAENRPDGREDPHHANPEFGKLMLRRIMAIRQQRAA